MNTLYRSFGALLRQTRIRSGLTQEDLGKRIGLSRTAITSIEKGNQGVTLQQLYELAAELNVSPRELLPGENFEVPTDAPAHVEKLVAQQSDQLLLIEMIKGRKNASRS